MERLKFSLQHTHTQTHTVLKCKIQIKDMKKILLFLLICEMERTIPPVHFDINSTEISMVFFTFRKEIIKQMDCSIYVTATLTFCIPKPMRIMQNLIGKCKKTNIEMFWSGIHFQWIEHADICIKIYRLSLNFFPSPIILDRVTMYASLI